MIKYPDNLADHLKPYYTSLVKQLDKYRESVRGLKPKHIRNKKLLITVKCGKCGKRFEMVFTLPEYVVYLKTQLDIMKDYNRLMTHTEVIKLFRYKSVRFLKHLYYEVCPACLQEEERLDIDNVMTTDETIRDIINETEKKDNVSPTDSQMQILR